MARTSYDDYRSNLFYAPGKNYNALDAAIDEYFNNLFDGFAEFDLINTSDNFEDTDFDSAAGDRISFNTTDDEWMDDVLERTDAFSQSDAWDVFDGEDVDYVEKKTTSRVAGRITQHYEDRQRGQIVDEEVALCLGIDCKQAIPGSRRRAVIDSTFVTSDNKRALLEVDDTQQGMDNHKKGHQQIIKEAVKRCRTNRACLEALAKRVNRTRSIFVIVARSGRAPKTHSGEVRVREIRTVDYKLNPKTGKLTTVEGSLLPILLPQNLNVQQMLNRGLLNQPPHQRLERGTPRSRSRRSLSSVPQLARQRPARTASAPQRRQRGQRHRFDAFAAFF